MALVFTFVYYMLRNVISFQEFTACIPEGFKAMIAPILILTMAWTLSGVTNLLGANVFVAELVGGSAQAFQGFLARDHFRGGRRACLCHRNLLGNLRNPDSHCDRRVPGGTDDGDLHAACLAGAVVRRPLFPDFRHYDYGIRRRALPSCEPCDHAAAVCDDGCRYLLCGVCDRRDFHAARHLQMAWLALPVCIVILFGGAAVPEKEGGEAVGGLLWNRRNCG